MTLAEAAVRTGVLMAIPIIVVVIFIKGAQPYKRPEERKTSLTGPERRKFGRLPAGEPTQEEDYCIPILQALVEFGGGTEMDTLLEQVGEIMRGTLREVDYEPLPSKPDERRWWNKAQWARQTMVHKKGWMRADSRTAHWEIGDASRHIVQEAQGKA
jgi:hypothetical protein